MIRLSALAACSLAVKLAFFGWVYHTDAQRVWDGGDTLSYVRPAAALVAHGTFASAPETPETPEILRTPGYPLWLALSLSLFGSVTVGTVVSQLLLSTVSLLLAARVADRLFDDPRVGPLAAGLVAVDLVSFALAQTLLSETLFTVLLAASVCAAVEAARSREPVRWAVAAGGLVSLAALVRPIAHGLPLVLAAALAVIHRSAGVRRGSALVAGAVLLPAIVLVGGWQLRNRLVADTWMLSSVQSHIIESRTSQVDGGRGFRGGGPAAPRTRPVSPDARDRDGVGRLLQRPALFLAWGVRNASRILMGPGEHRFIRLLGYPESDAPGLDLRRVVPGRGRRTGDVGWWIGKWWWPARWPVLPFAWAALVVVAVNLGIARWVWLTWRDRRWTPADVVIWAVIVYSLLAGNPSSRFRVPIMPLLSVYAAAGWLGVTSASRSRSDADVPEGTARLRPTVGAGS